MLTASFSDELLRLFICQIWQVTILCVLAAWASKTVLRNHPAWCYDLWLLVFIKCLIPPVWSSHCGVFSWCFQRLSVASTRLIQGSLGTRFSTSMIVVSVLVFWLCGVAWFLLRTLVSWHRLQSRINDQSQAVDESLQTRFAQLVRKLGIRKSVRLVVTNESVGPAVIGAFRPLFVLPARVAAGKSPDELEPILIHELLHIRRGDTFVAVLETIVRACWWFHPHVQRGADIASQACEFCCDEDVLAETSVARRDYADSLVHVLEVNCPLQPMISPPSIRADQVTQERLRRIMTRGASQKSPRLWLRIAIIILGLLILLPGRSIFSPSDAASRSTNVEQSVRQAAP